MARLNAVLLAALLVATVAAGCAGGGDRDDDPVSPMRTLPYTAHERVALPFNVTGDWSQTLAKGVHDILPGVGHVVDVTLPATDLGAAVLAPTTGPQVHLGLFLPDIPGCDWTASSLPEECHIPVIGDAGPYYAESTGARREAGLSGTPALSGEMDPVATEPANRLGRFLIENYVPHGYAVAQISVFGSGDSNHCFDMFGMAEQLGVSEAVTWLGSQPWSNGKVALIGRSYDGSTPWQPAALGNPHLATIVPISGLHGLQALVTRNGTSEARVASFQNVVYGGYGIDGEPGDIHTLCTDWLSAAPMGAAALLTGDEAVPLDEGYWREREFLPRALENYAGSVFFIHGLQDWNVDPHLISPAFQQLRDAGLDVKGLFGQWGHMYPDRPGEHENLPDGSGGAAYPFTVRYDWAEDLLEWFDFYLKGQGPRPVLKVEVQDNIGRWRVEDTYPPTQVAYTPVAIPGPPAQIGVNEDATTYDLGVLDAGGATLLSGHMYLEAALTPTGANGQIHYTVRDADSGLRLAFGTLDLRHRTSEQSPLVPGQQVVARVQSQPFEFVVPAGHRLELTVAQTGDGLLPQPTAQPMEFEPSASSLLLPVAVRPASAFFTPPAWNGTATATEPQP